MKKTNSNKRRKVRIIILAALILLTGALAAAKTLILPGLALVRAADIKEITSSTDSFKYDASKMETGMVYHYVKSNVDGSTPVDIAAYTAGNDRVEVFKIYPGSKTTFLVTAVMDWETFSAKELSTVEISGDGSRKLTARAELSKEKNEYRYAIGENQYSVPIGHYPVHNYNFDLTSLNFSFRHLVDPESGFSIGIHFPSLSLSSLVKFVYSGTADIKYISDEAYGGRTCRKYTIGGQGLRNRSGTIWVDKEGGYIVNVEIPVADNPSFNSFKLKLTGTEKMTSEDWNKYVAASSQEYFKNRK